MEPTPQKAPQTCSAAVEPEDGAPRQFKTPDPWLGVCPSHERMEARALHIPPSICSVHEFTSGGHQAGFTTGQQKHVILRRTPYLGAYVRENQVHVPLISIIHHKLCKGAIGRAKPHEPQIKHTGLCYFTSKTIKATTILTTSKRWNCQQMSSYFVNSFCGRYPNGADFQLHNYGDHSTANEQYRDSTTMHSSRYGYGYNGMDLTVGRAGAGHFVGNERTRGYSPSHSAATTPSVEPVRYNQSASTTGTSSLSPPPEPLPCSSVASASPVTDTQSQHRAVKNSITTPCSSSNGGTLLLNRDCVSKASPLEEEKPAGSGPTTPQNVTDSTQPQIYPWMRKLHISHGKLFLLLFFFMILC